MKSETKARLCALKRDQTKTGGGCATSQQMSAGEERMLDVMGTVSVEGVRGGIDTSDSTNEG